MEKLKYDLAMAAATAKAQAEFSKTPSLKVAAKALNNVTFDFGK